MQMSLRSGRPAVRSSSQPLKNPRAINSKTVESSAGDYVDQAVDYAIQAIADVGRQKFCDLIRAAARRFLGDLIDAGEGQPFMFDRAAANEICWFVEQMPHVEGEWDSPNIKLHPSHTFFLVQLFGFKRPDGNRRFTSALFAVARKNAKSTVAAPVGLYLLSPLDGQVGPQVISGATTGDQARIIWSIAKRMAMKEHELREAFDFECLANAIVCNENGGTFRPINAKASTQDGLNPSAVLLDEIHAHKTADLVNVLDSAGGARRSRLFLYTTTEGYTSAGPWAELRAYAKNLLSGTVEADHFLACFYQLDDDDDIHDETKWIKANPLIDVNPALLDAIRKDSIDARAMPSKLAEFRIKRCNREAVAADSWLDLVAWDECGNAVDLDWLSGFPCYGGIDLASTSDINAMRLYWEIDGGGYTAGWNWCPRDAAEQLTLSGTPRYSGWVEQGLIKQTPGNMADYAVIENDLLELYERFDIQKIAYDPWNAADLVNRLVDQGLPMVQFIQGGKSYHPAMQHAERKYKSGKLSHGGDTLLRWALGNVVPRYDANMNQSPDKKRSPEKIDPACALFMACGAFISENDESIDEKYEVLTV